MITRVSSVLGMEPGALLTTPPIELWPLHLSACTNVSVPILECQTHHGEHTSSGQTELFEPEARAAFGGLAVFSLPDFLCYFE